MAAGTKHSAALTNTGQAGSEGHGFYWAVSPNWLHPSRAPEVFTWGHAGHGRLGLGQSKARFGKSGYSSSQVRGQHLGVVDSGSTNHNQGPPTVQRQCRGSCAGLLLAFSLPTQAWPQPFHSRRGSQSANSGIGTCLEAMPRPAGSGVQAVRWKPTASRWELELLGTVLGADAGSST